MIGDIDVFCALVAAFGVISGIFAIFFAVSLPEAWRTQKRINELLRDMRKGDEDE